ncbi:YbgC/FadM family acyl-CoA thioesterase [Sandaracinobacteroides saxicola]|uniref:YbgC/FadM family acyl-CoA thioesterase n=1 Tax=Sandaracinobacteroides saxicola TaxID=2759707 RepID=UPI001FB0C40B|nr:YbgC/FadM family acyl-CoA thioesterase [Sandaracinobacteroides saxicola]
MKPLTGAIESGVHRFAVRVYFEDTDFSGVVYHANYLRYMERARSDLLRVAGIDQREAHASGTGVYAIRDLSIDYLSPARLEDDLLIETRVTALGAATVSMVQAISRDGRLLTDATIRAAFLTPDGRPRRQPADWMAGFRRLMIQP